MSDFKEKEAVPTASIGERDSERGDKTSDPAAPTGTSASDHDARIAAVDAQFGFTAEEQKRIVRRVDIRLVLTVGAMYCVSLMDRTNLGAANIAGMSIDLQLIGNRYVSYFAERRGGAEAGAGARGDGWNRELTRRRGNLERHLAGLLRHICPLPTALDYPDPQDRPKNPSFRHHRALGFVHDWYGLRQELGHNGRSPNIARCS